MLHFTHFGVCALVALVSVTGEIVNPGSNLCLNVENLKNDYSNVGLSDCSGKGNQSFSIMHGTIMNTHTGGCVDIFRPCTDGSNSNGCQRMSFKQVKEFLVTNKTLNVQMYPCHGDSNQKWVVRSNGLVRNEHLGVCLDVYRHKKASGERVGTSELSAGANAQVYKCHEQDNQKWDLKPYLGNNNDHHQVKQGGIVNPASKMCLGMSDKEDPYANVELSKCTGMPAQRFDLIDGMIKNNHTGGCVDLYAPCKDKSNSKGCQRMDIDEIRDYLKDVEALNVQMTPCHGEENQKWDVQSNGLIKNEAAGVCMDIFRPQKDDGSRASTSELAAGIGVQVFACHAGDNQRWDFEPRLIGDEQILSAGDEKPNIADGEEPSIAQGEAPSIAQGEGPSIADGEEPSIAQGEEGSKFETHNGMNLLSKGKFGVQGIVGCALAGMAFVLVAVLFAVRWNAMASARDIESTQMLSLSEYE